MKVEKKREEIQRVQFETKKNSILYLIQKVRDLVILIKLKLFIIIIRLLI